VTLTTFHGSVPAEAVATTPRAPLAATATDAVKVPPDTIVIVPLVGTVTPPVPLLAVACHVYVPASA